MPKFSRWVQSPPMPPRPPALTIQPVRNGRGLVARRAAECIHFDAVRSLTPEGQPGVYWEHSCNPTEVLFNERFTPKRRPFETLHSAFPIGAKS